jgi:hypothetical protein
LPRSVAQTKQKLRKRTYAQVCVAKTESQTYVCASAPTGVCLRKRTYAQVCVAKTDVAKTESHLCLRKRTYAQVCVAKTDVDVEKTESSVFATQTWANLGKPGPKAQVCSAYGGGADVAKADVAKADVAKT